MSERSNSMTATMVGGNTGRLRRYEFTVEVDGDESIRGFIGSSLGDAKLAAQRWAERTGATIVKPLAPRRFR